MNIDENNNLVFKQVNPQIVHPLMLKYHYLHRIVGCAYAYAMYLNDNLVGMVTYGRVRQSLAQSISNNAGSNNTLELSRLYIKDEVSQTVPNITSQFVSWSLRQLRKLGNWYIISFADSGMHHVGAIYQATNFLYCGTTRKGIFCYNGPHKKGGQWKAGVHYRFFIIRSKKYRYIKFVGSKSFRKHVRKELKFDVLPYPKADKIHYSVGDTEERFIKDRKTGKVYSEKELLKSFPDYNWNDGGEEWKQFHNYKVSNQGRIYSLTSKRFLKPFTDGKKAYLYVDLTINHKLTRYLVHRLVALLFIPNPEHLPYVNHKDENKKNNYVGNLEWCTAHYNVNYGNNIRKIRHTKMTRGLTTPIYAISTKNNQAFYFESVKFASKVLNVGERNISNCLKETTRSLNGFVFIEKDSYSSDKVVNKIALAKLSTKYPRDYIVDGNWVVGTTNARKIIGVTRTSINSAIRKGRDMIKGHSIRVPNDSEIKNHYNLEYQELKKSSNGFYSSYLDI